MREDGGEGARVTAAPPRYRYTFRLPVRQSIIRGNVCARNYAEALALLVCRYGAVAAEQAVVQMVDLEDVK